MTHVSTNRTVLVSMALAAALTAAGLGVTVRNTAQVKQTSALVVHTKEATEAISAVLQSASDLETGTRGFVITADPAFLQPYHAARTRIAGEIDHLGSLTAENPRQQRHLAVLRRHVEAQLAWRAGLVDTVQAEGPDAGRRLVDFGEGRAGMDAVRAVAAAMTAEENRLLDERREASARSERMAQAALGVLAILVAGVVMGSYLMIRSQLAHRGRTEDALRRSADQIQDLYDRAPCGYHSLDAGGAIVAVNQTELDWLGYSRDELIGKRWVDLLTEASRRVFSENFLRFKANGAISDLEFELVCKDGRTLPVLLSATAITDAEGRFVASRSTMIDLSRRKEMEAEVRQLNEELERRVRARTRELEVAVEDLQASVAEHERTLRALRESEEHFRLLVDGVKEYGLIMLDREGRVASWNNGAQAITGYSADDIVGQPVSALYADPVSGGPDESLVRTVAEGRFETEGWRVRKDGSRFWAHVVMTPLRDEFGELRGFAKLTRDITERRRAEQEILRLNADLESRVRDRTRALEDANGELEAFSYSVSHDLRAPLRHIHGYVEMLRRSTDGQLSPASLRYLETISSASREMGTLIDDLLAFSRMGRAELRHEPVDLAGIVHECVGSIGEALQGRRINWAVSPLPGVVGDRAMLKQVVINLIDNAVKYTRPRDPAEIEVGCAGQEDDRLVLFVRDNGVGFDPQYAGKLFGVFQRLHRADEFEGTGIGLATVRRIIARHGGRAWAEGQLDRGTAVYFTLRPASASAPYQEAH